jgi:RNA polymerase sigma-70 factor, ECF subfamily
MAMDDSADVGLVEQVLERGDAGAYATLISRHYETAYRQACRLVDDSIEAQDLVQEAFLKAHLQLHTLRNPACYADWLRHIIYSICMDWHRQFRFQLYRSSRGSSSTWPLEELADPHTPTPLDLLLRSELMAQLREAAAGLAPRYRQSFLLYHLDQLSGEEVAEKVGVSMNTAMSLLYRARSKVRQALNEYVQETPDCTAIALDFNSLPSRQGWRYRSGYEFLPGGPSEERVCQVRNGILTIDTADLFPDTLAVYALYGVVDPYRPFVLRLRACKLRETARYPEYQVSLKPRRPRNQSFGVCLCTGTDVFHLEISACQLRLNRLLLSDAIDNRQLHDYRLEGTPGVGCRLFVDEVEVGSALPDRLHSMRNMISFGDLSPATGNFRAEITHLSFTQMRPGIRIPNKLNGNGVADLLHLRPFSALGSIDFRSPAKSGRYARESTQQLHQVIRQYSKKWQLGPNDPIRPVDFAAG